MKKWQKMGNTEGRPLIGEGCDIGYVAVSLKYDSEIALFYQTPIVRDKIEEIVRQL